MADNINLNNPLHVGSPSTGTKGVSDTAAFEDYFKTVYPEVWREQFYETDGIYKFAKKVAIKQQYLPLGFRLTRSSQQSYTLGDTWNNISPNSPANGTTYNEDYEIPYEGNIRLGERITGRVTTKRFISIMHLSEDFIYKAQNSDLDIDLLNEMFDDHEKIQTHRQKSQLYLSKNGNLGNVVGGNINTAGTIAYTAADTTGRNFAVTLEATPVQAELLAGSGYARPDVNTTGTVYPVLALKIENDAYFLEGEKVLLKGDAGIVTDSTSVTKLDVALELKVWQKDYTDLANPVILFQVTKVYGELDGKAIAAPVTPFLIKKGAYLARLQLAVGGDLPVAGSVGSTRIVIKPEYEGLKDILFTNNNVVSGINRKAYPIFNCSVTNLNNKILTAEALTVHLNSMRRRNSALVDTKVIAASPEALSAVETSFLQLYKYTADPTSGNTVNIGINEVKFYDHTLLKDDFAEHGKAYIVKPGVWAEAEYRPWSWITGGADAVFGFMDRISQKGIYEGWMVRDANGYTEEFNVHSGFIGLSETINTGKFSGLDSV